MSAYVFLLALLFTPQILNERVNIKIPREFEYFLIVLVIVTALLAKQFAPILFGIIMGMVSLLLLFILYHSNQIKKNKFLIFFLPLSLTIMFGTFLEMAKFLIKKFVLHQNLAGLYEFTMMNFVYVTIGALVASLFGFFYVQTNANPIRKLIFKFFRLNPNLPRKTGYADELLDLIRQGENDRIEFKSTLRMNLHTNEIDKRVEGSVLKTIAAFLNSSGGTLLIGVSDSGDIVGTESDRFKDQDNFNLHLMNLIRGKVGKPFIKFIRFKHIDIKGKDVVRVECEKSNSPVFLDEEFYIRMGPSSTHISGKDLIDYVKTHFGKNA